MKKIDENKKQFIIGTKAELEEGYCIHCYPAKEHHFPQKMGSIIRYYFTDPITCISSAVYLKKITQLFWKTIQRGVLDLSQWIHHASLTDNIDRTQLDNSVLVIWDAGKERNLKIFNVEFSGKYTSYFLLMHQGKKYYFDRNPIYLLSKKFKYSENASQYDDKSYFKKFLLRHRIPCPRGKPFISTKKALKYGLALGFPLVVKPSISTLSKHVSIGILSLPALKEAIKIAKQMDYRIVVEQHILGDVHRVTLFNDKVIACIKREPASIIGNGKKTVNQLIDERNSHSYQGVPKERNNQIIKNKHLEAILRKQGCHLKTILKKSQKIFLSEKINMASGAVLTNVTSLIHAENEALFIQIHQLLNLPLTGLDFICQDISQSWRLQSFAIIENNSLPYLDIHHYPSHGEPIDAAGLLWDFVLQSLG